MKYYFLILLIGISLIINCQNEDLRLELEINRDFNVEVENLKEKTIFDGVKPTNEIRIILKCSTNVCKIYENDNKIIEKIIDEKEKKFLNKNLESLKNKENKEKYKNTNTKIFFENEILLTYIPLEIEKIFGLFSYQNKILLSDEKEFEIDKFDYEVLNEYGDIWKLYCEYENCKILYSSNNKKQKFIKNWNFKLSNNEIKKLKKILVEVFILEKTYIKFRTESRQELILDNGKVYTRNDTKYYKKIFDEFFNINIEK